MPALFEHIFQKMGIEYRMNNGTLREYADKGCNINHKLSLKEFVEHNPSYFETEEVAEEFLVTIISVGMTETLQDIVKESPFKKIQYKKPSIPDFPQNT